MLGKPIDAPDVERASRVPGASICARGASCEHFGVHERLKSRDVDLPQAPRPRERETVQHSAGRIDRLTRNLET